MKITMQTPTPKTATLGTLPLGQLFRFVNRSGVYMNLRYGGDDFLCLYMYAHSRDELIDDMLVFTKELYVWTEDDNDIDYKYYIGEDNTDKLCAYIDMQDGHIHFSHKDEPIEKLNGELLVSFADN
jgi:hypothetical protein